MLKSDLQDFRLYSYMRIGVDNIRDLIVFQAQHFQNPHKIATKNGGNVQNSREVVAIKVSARLLPNSVLTVPTI